MTDEFSGSIWYPALWSAFPHGFPRHRHLYVQPQAMKKSSINPHASSLWRSTDGNKLPYSCVSGLNNQVLWESLPWRGRLKTSSSMNRAPFSSHLVLSNRFPRSWGYLVRAELHTYGRAAWWDTECLVNLSILFQYWLCLACRYRRPGEDGACSVQSS